MLSAYNIFPKTFMSLSTHVFSMLLILKFMLQNLEAWQSLNLFLDYELEFSTSE